MDKILTIILLIILNINASEELKQFRVGYISSSMSNYSKKDLEVSMNIWLKKIAKTKNYKAQMIFYDNPKDAAQDIIDNKIDYISAFPLIFVKYFDLSTLSDAFSGGPDNLSDNLFVVLSKNSSKIKSWKDIKKPKIGIQKNDEIMFLYSQYKTKNKNLFIYKYSNRNRVVLDLFFNKLDLAIVPYKSYKIASELNPQIKQKIKVLETTNINSTNIGLYRKTLDESIKKEIYNMAIKLFSTVEGKEMMLVFKADKMISTKLSDLKPIDEFYKKYLKFKKGK
jgi:hypothetical protein